MKIANDKLERFMELRDKTKYVIELKVARCDN